MALYDTDFSRAHGTSNRMAGGMTMGLFAALTQMPANTMRPARAPGPMATLAARAYAAIADWRERRATRAALQKLSERELDDIGLTRADIARML